MTTIPFCLPEDLTPELFLTNYWQKKPLLIKNGLPAIANLFHPDDVLDLAISDDVSARLITQKNNATSDAHKNNHQANQWTIKHSPLTDKDLDNLPNHWTVLVQNLEAWSDELGRLWQAFDFIPRWQQDDIMVSYAPKGGSVGKHYDEYDVFLAQGFGARRWQLGKFCDDNTAFVDGEPIRVLDDMGDIIFDEVLQAGDVLYVPPRLSHYGVAVNDCLTFSFGFRRPSMVQILDKLADVATHHKALFTPIILNSPQQRSAFCLTQNTIDDIKTQLIHRLQSGQLDKIFDQAISELVSRRQYEPLAFFDELTVDDLHDYLTHGATLTLNHASRFICRDNNCNNNRNHNNNHGCKNGHDNNHYSQNNTNTWYINGEAVNFDDDTISILMFFINGGILDSQKFNDLKTEYHIDDLSDMLSLWINNNWLMLNIDNADTDSPY